MEETQTKTVPITKRMVWEAYKQVRKKGKATGVDNQSMKEFEEKLKKNLYKLWNRLASGSYFPQAVKEEKTWNTDNRR
jgi:RNA-directed DNA polymerase